MLLKALAVREWEILNAFADRGHTRLISAIILAPPNRAIFPIKIIRVAICILTLASTCLHIAKPILAAVRAVLDLKCINVNVAERIRAVAFVASIPMPAIHAGAS